MVQINTIRAETSVLLNDTLNANKSDWPHMKDILIFVTMSVTVLSTLITNLSFCKIRKLSVALVLLQKANYVKGFTSNVPSFIYKAPPKPESSNSFFIFTSNLTWEHAIFSLCLIHFLFVLLILTCRKYSNNKTMLHLEITSGDSCIIMPVMHLPLCPTYCKIKAPSDICNFALHGPWYQKVLTFDWPNFIITDCRNNMPVLVPNNISLSLKQYFKIRSILKKPFFVYVHIQHKGFLMPINDRIQTDFTSDTL
jgi:hypothetical protein